MKICELHIIGSLLILPCVFGFVESSRTGDFCNVDKTCQELSNNFSNPYCADKKNDCIWPVLTNKLSSFKSGDIDTPLGEVEVREIISNYCSSLGGNGDSGRIYYAKGSSVRDDTWDWQQTFDSHQSIFVYALCSSFKGEDGKSMPFLKDSSLSGIFKDEDIVKVLKLKQRSGGKDKCSLQDNPNLKDCDMSVYATVIFSTIMSDIFKIKYAQVMDVDGSENFDSNKKVEEFMHGYFGYKEKYTDLKNEFPQTVDVLKSNQKYYKKVLDTLKIIDNAKLVGSAKASKCPSNGMVTGVDFVACALHSSQEKGLALTPSFITMIYNEILNYNIFELYVQHWIDAKVDYMSSKQGKNEKEIREYKAKSLDFNGYAGLQIQATKYALRTFEDFNMTYPLHIGLLLYQEKMKIFRDKKLSPIVTLFYSLSEKLQNVQLPN